MCVGIGEAPLPFCSHMSLRIIGAAEDKLLPQARGRRALCLCHCAPSGGAFSLK